MGTFAVYVTPDDIITNSSANVDPLSYVGLETTLSADAPAGSTVLHVVSATGAPTGTDTFWILDGYTSEKGKGTMVGTTITLSSPTLADHSAGASVSSAGVSGCLASLIVDASRMVDTACRQCPRGAVEKTLYAIARTESYTLQTSRAYADSDGTLTIWPWHFPVQSLTSIALQMGAVPTNPVDLTSLVLPEGARDIAIPYVGLTGASSTRVSSLSLRETNVWAILTYTGGPIVGTTLDGIPDEIKRACTYYVMHLLSYRVNPTGAMSVSQGEVSRHFGIRGESKSRLVADAEDLLEPYSVPRKKKS